MFLSSYENKLDKKGRVSVPSSFRAYLNSMGYNGFITYPSFNHAALDGCAQDRIEKLSESIESDSILTVTKECGWFWFQGQPVNYDPSVLPRSQDAEMLIKESTGLYGINNKSLGMHCCRIGQKPIMHEISPIESLDIDTEHEFNLAQKLSMDSKMIIS